MLKLLILALSLLFLSSNALAKAKPNIVYILVDNWGWGDIRSPFFMLLSSASQLAHTDVTKAHTHVVRK